MAKSIYQRLQHVHADLTCGQTRNYQSSNILKYDIRSGSYVEKDYTISGLQNKLNTGCDKENTL